MLRLQLCIFLGAFFSWALVAQDQDIFTPIEDYCKPGVSWKAPSKGILYDLGVYPGINLKADGAENTNQVNIYTRTRFKMKIPILHKGPFKLLIGFNHYREHFDFGSIAPKHYDLFNSIDDAVLKKSELGVYINKSINKKIYLSIKASSSFNGDYDQLINFDHRYANHRLAAILGIKRSPDRELGFGFYARKGFRNTRVFPFVFYNRSINEKWGYHLVLPIQMRVRYSFTPKHILLTGTEFKSQDYSLDLIELNNDDFQIMHMRRSEFSLSTEYFHQLGKWVWMSIKGGYVYHLKTEFTRLDAYSETPDGTLNVRPSAGPFIKVGLFIAPPKKYLKGGGPVNGERSLR